MNPLRRLFATACLAIAALQAAVAAPVTIMPLGDSITEGGTGFHVYRYPLMKKLIDAGYRVSFVGSKTTQPLPGSPLGALAHEGYAGKNLAFIRERFETSYRAHPADILLVHAGHNQFADQKPVPGMLADTRALIATARALNPRVIVLLGQVIPSGKLPKYSYIPEFNRSLVALAAELNTPAQPVMLVDHATGFDWKTDTISDLVHPNAQGAEKMASRWFAALKKILPLPAATSVTPSASSVPPSLRLWPGDAPGVPARPGPEVAEPNGRVSNVSVPTLDVYLPPADKANGTALIICSGGGYTRLASGPLGRDAAAIFNPLGYAVFSLKYRVSPPSDNVLRDALVDARRAVRLVRSRASEWKISPDRVGLIGFSAGANLILNLATSPSAGIASAADPLDRLGDRPDFIALAATWPNNQKITSFAIDRNTPPAFVLHTRDDTTAPFRFAEEITAAWTRAGVPVVFTPFDQGGHMAFNFPVPAATDWTAAFHEWLRTLPL